MACKNRMACKKYFGLVINRERLLKNWSQEELCHGICTVSYLSRIETGKADPSDEILHLLFDRLGLVVDEAAEQESLDHAEEAYALLFSGMTDKLKEYLGQINIEKYRASCAGLDLLLLYKIAFPSDHGICTAHEGMYECMERRQLALFRIIQGKQDEALLIYPNAYTYLQAGLANYNSGNYISSIDKLQTSYYLAAREGLAKIMLETKTALGNCYFNLLDVHNMYHHYETAANLAKAMDDRKALEHIAYYTASIRINMGEYEKAYRYFSTLEDPDILRLHKLAICCEKTGRRTEGLTALDRAEALNPDHDGETLTDLMCRVVRYRLEHEDYLEQDEYGELLLHCYNECLKERPAGFEVFHLPWMLEWYKATRQYKKICEFLSEYPTLSLMNSPAARF